MIQVICFLVGGIGVVSSIILLVKKTVHPLLPCLLLAASIFIVGLGIYIPRLINRTPALPHEFREDR